MDKKYEIGYGRPPVEHQFKQGQSGNKKGRPKGRKNTCTLLNEILKQKIPLKENGQVLWTPKKVALLMQLVNKGVKGDIKAIDILLPLLQSLDMKEEERNKILADLNTDDQEIFNNFLPNLKNLKDIEEDEDYESAG